MVKQTEDSGFEYELITRIATLYYLEELTQEKIAQNLNLSRVKVGRLLKKARQEGIVEINVRPHPGLNIQLEAEREDSDRVCTGGMRTCRWGDEVPAPG